jgi:hypothetical protein
MHPKPSLRVSGIPSQKPSDVTHDFPRQRQAAGIPFWSLWSPVGEPCATRAFSAFPPFPGAALLDQPWIHINGATLAFSLALCLKKTRRHFIRPAYYGVPAQTTRRQGYFMRLYVNRVRGSAIAKKILG